MVDGLEKMSGCARQHIPAVAAVTAPSAFAALAQRLVWYGAMSQAGATWECCSGFRSWIKVKYGRRRGKCQSGTAASA